VIPLVTEPAWGRVPLVKREKRLTKREQKALKAPRPGATAHQHGEHIHCIACGRHLDPAEFDAPVTMGAPLGATPSSAPKPPAPTARLLRCQHGTQFPTCVECADRSRQLLVTHDRTNQPVAQASAWH
jgi:hypothetical protein